MNRQISTLKKQNPRLFYAGVIGSAFLLVALLHLWQTPDYSAYYSDLVHAPIFGPRDLSAAVLRSEALWAKNKSKRNKYIQAQGGLGAMKMFATRGVTTQKYTVWDIYTPSWPCPWEVERIGGFVDGGKYTCGLPRIEQAKGDGCVVYSFGVERESSFEAEILRRTQCEVFLFDFSVREAGPHIAFMEEETQKRAHFFQYGIAGENMEKDGHQFYTLKTLMEQNGHDWIDILKIDVEGAEFSVLPDIIKEFGDGNLPFSQLLIELHLDHNQKSLEEFGAFWESLEQAGLRAFSSELNYPSIFWLAYPTAMEMNFINTCNGAKKCGKLVR